MGRWVQWREKMSKKKAKKPNDGHRGGPGTDWDMTVREAPKQMPVVVADEHLKTEFPVIDLQ